MNNSVKLLFFKWEIMNNELQVWIKYDNELWGEMWSAG